MLTLDTWQNLRVFRLGLALACGLVLLLGLLSALDAAQPVVGLYNAQITQPHALQNSATAESPVVTHTASQQWVGISGDCVVFRDDRTASGGVYLYNLTTGETFTITEEPDQANKVVVSQGVVVWRSDREGVTGLWGYYNPLCSDAGPFTATEVITAFHVISRATAQAPALSGEMLTFDTWAPKGEWYVALVELDADNDGIPDAIEPGYDPAGGDLLIPISYPLWQGSGIGQRFSDVYWDDDYKVACWYDNAGGVERIECNDLHHLYDPSPWNYRFTVITSTWIPLVNFKGILAVHRDLVVWTDGRDYDLSGFDLYIADLDSNDDGNLDTEDPAVYVLVNYPWHQQYPDIWWPFVVWADRRNGNQSDIHAYDLSLDSDDDGTPNWKDSDRFCIDPAEFPVVLHPATQIHPEVWNGTVVWEDDRNGNWDIYSATLQPVQPQPRVPVSGTAQEKALHWLDQQTVHFSQVQSIPGYIAATGMITRYKSFMQVGVEHTRRAWYSPSVGSYVVGYDYCYYGTPDQKRYLGRFGRGFTYDQALALIAHTMLSQAAEAQELGSYVSTFQNSGQLTTTIGGSFGFSFNGQGYWGEKDNFYDMDYLRTGANAWMGYGLLFYTHKHTDTQFMNVITGVADYILDHQILTPTDDRLGLFKGGFGRWITEPDIFTDERIGWAATEHNIDVYFFLRDLGQMTGDSRYSEAAELLRANMPNLWDDDKGRLNQGMGITGTLNTGDALDAASWGAMYWVAVGDLEKARRSLEYADRAYSNTVTISDSGKISPAISIWGYKPYSGTVETFDWSTANVVWSEGSLGVAMAYLKLGHALLDCGDLQGDTYVQKAKDIVAEMEKLQELDPEGGVLYAKSPDEDIPDIPQAPSVAGTAWLLMVQRAIEDEAMRDAFWGQDQDIIRCTTISGPTAGLVKVSYTFTTSVSPITTTLPVTYVWQVSEQSPVTYTDGLSSTAVFTWDTSGSKSITVTAANTRNMVTGVYMISIQVPPSQVDISGPAIGATKLSHSFTTSVSPITTTLPVTYTWQATGQSESVTNVDSLSDTVAFSWSTTGTKAITVTATNATGISVSATHNINIETPLLVVSKVGPAAAQAGDLITYTIRVTNTGNITLTATITDFRSAHVTPTGDLSWTPIVITPDDMWSEMVTVTVKPDYVGILSNTVRVTTREGATGETEVTTCVGFCVYLPIVLKNP